jgi:glutaminyl-tRNA synthetase
MESRNFIEEKIDNEGVTEVYTRFPPEPNGYIHLGHSKSIYNNFSIAERYNGKCNLRFDDTNPSTEDTHYVDSIRRDVEWLGFKPTEIRFSSDYFNTLYNLAIELIKKGKAYVCELTPDEIATRKGTPTRPGTDSPYRNRSVEENLDLFNRMKNGEFEDGSMCLRAKIDMSSPNMHMRDPIIYRIKNESHHRTGNDWCIYPMYDFAHCLSDAIEGITHSLCTLEFEVHRPLYDWIIDELVDIDERKPKQTEFARLNLSYTLMSKRKLKELVDNKIVDGWDDPRMPTISGLRRRGYTPASIRNFCEKVGVTRKETLIDVALLESCMRDDLNKRANRVMCVMNPLKVTITNYPEDKIEMVEAKNNPGDESAGTRMIPFSRNLYIERDDFMEDAPRKFYRLSNDKEVRFKFAYYITCNEVIKDENGEIVELLCTYDPETRGGWSDDGRKVKGTIHWVCADKHEDIEVRLYDRLFKSEEVSDDYMNDLNENSLEIVSAKIEPDMEIEDTVQFERIGYFILDKDSSDKRVFNKTIGLRDTWAKMNK